MSQDKEEQRVNVLIEACTLEGQSAEPLPNPKKLFEQFIKEDFKKKPDNKPKI